MSLDKIQLPAFVIQDLFKNSLVDLNTTQAATGNTDADGIAFLGKNQRRIALVVRSSEALYLPEAALEFLMGILGACQLTMADVALVNLHQQPDTGYQQLTEALQAEKIFLFGTSPADLQLPLDFPFYQIQRYNNQVYLAAPPLAQLQQDRMEKSKLWSCLKQIFSL